MPKSEMDNIKKNIEKEVIKLINSGVVYFGIGGARGFDLFATEVLLQLKKTYPVIKVIFVIPCTNHYISWNKNDAEKYKHLSNCVDKVKVLSLNYYDGCMLARNRHLVDNSSYLICYKRHQYGGTAYTEKYAQKQNLKIIYI